MNSRQNCRRNQRRHSSSARIVVLLDPTHPVTRVETEVFDALLGRLDQLIANDNQLNT